MNGDNFEKHLPNIYSKIPTISSSKFQPFLILAQAPQIRNAKKPPIISPSEYKPGGLIFGICPQIQNKPKQIFAFITTRLDFCNSLLYGLPNQLIQRLQSVQNSAARLISLTTKYEHISPILRELHWLPVQYRIHFKIILLTFKCFNNSAPAYLKDLIEQYVPRRALRSGNKNYLTIPRYKLKTYGRRSFSVAAPLLWNSLPQDMRDATIHPEVFKKKLKTYFFKTAFNIQ